MLCFALLLLTSSSIHAQVEMVPVQNRVYSFLEDLSMRGLIDYNNGSIPLSREEVAAYLEQLAGKRSKLSGTENAILNDLLVEFSYDINKITNKSFSLFSNLNPDGLLNVFNDEKQKYLVFYTDQNFSLFLDGIGALSFRDFNMQGSPGAQVLVGEIGPRLRASYDDILGLYIHITGGKSLNGDLSSRAIASAYDPLLRASPKFIADGFVDWFTGYLRLQTKDQVLSMTLGRESFEMGDGYIDKLFVSDNMPPFDFARFDFNYKFFHYAFFYGNLKGDSLGVPLNSKNMVGHRLDIELSSKFRVGVFESLILSNEPPSFTYLNPVSYLESSNFAQEVKDNNNNLMGFDCEFRPYNNIGIQLSWLLDDANWSTLYSHDRSHDSNKFGYQAGLYYSRPFGINNLTAAVEYTRLDPFVYTHQSNMSNYTNWDVSIGTSLPPNSDEIALMLQYYLTNRVTLKFLYRHQRSGEGFLDANGNPTLNALGTIMRNFGGDLSRGDLDTRYYNTFLEGLRVNRDLFTLSARIEPIRQYYLDIDYYVGSINDIFISKSFLDQLLYVTASTDF